MAATVVKVGMPASLSGQFHMQGWQALAGLRAWAADANAAGGMDAGGRSVPVEVVHYDDESRRGQVREVTRRLILEDRVDLLMGPYSTVLSNAAAEVSDELGWTLWNQGGAGDGIYRKGHGRVVGILTPASRYLSGLLPLVRKADEGARTIAVVRAGSGAFPRAVSSGAEREAEGLDFETALVREYEPDNPGWDSIVAELAELEPDVLVAVGRIYNDLELGERLVEARLRVGAAAVVAAGIQQFRDGLGGEADGFIGPSQWEPGSTEAVDYGPPEAAVLASLERADGRPVDYPMAQAYAAGLVAQRCVEDAGCLEQDALRRAAGELDFSTFYGRFRIDPVTGEQVGRSVSLVQWQQGRKVVVWPPERRDGELVYPWRGG